MINPESILKSRDITLPTKVHLVKDKVFLVVMYGCESWTIKNTEHQRMMLLNCGVGEDSWESFGLQGIQPVHPKGNQSWIFIGRTDAEADTPILWPPDVKNWLIWKDPDVGKDWRRKEKGTTEDEMVGWHHQLNGHGFGWTPGVGDGQGGVLWFMGSQRVGYDWVNWTELKVGHSFSSKEQVSLNFMAAVTICSDFEAQENKVCYCFHCFPRKGMKERQK